MRLLDRVLIGLLIVIGVPCLIAVLVITVMVYLAAIDWVWMYLQAWWLA